MTFSKVLVANRGEIATRIIRSLKEAGIRAAAIYSEADKDSLPVQIVDEAYPIGPPPASKSYLNGPRIVDLAKQIKAEAIHPGYGFLAENSEFASLCEDAGIAFIGPTPENLKLAGDKRRARQMVEDARIPVIPGSHKALLSLPETREVSQRIGYPMMLKASAGGGGRGMRVVKDESALKEEFFMAAAEARAAFGDPTLYMERFIQNPRHIEVQILGDGKGKVIHLMERNCSIQRRHQKLIEEAPSPSLPNSLRESIHEAAVRIAQKINYRNAGTVEFLVDEENHFYFMEINARIQVEHPVTEMISGIDLIKAQISIAAGDGLDLKQSEVARWGYAIECRINAEDPEEGFTPSPGTIQEYRPPGGFGVRFDTHLFRGYEVPMYYDSLLGKLITWGRTREDAIRTMDRALQELTIVPLKTTVPFHLQVIRQDDFLKGTYRLDLVEQILGPEVDREEED